MRVLNKDEQEIDAEVQFNYKGYVIHIVSIKEKDEPEIYAILDGEDCGEANLHPDDEKTKPWTSVDDVLSWIDEDIECRNQESITFTCPECGGHNLVQLQNVMTDYQVKSITKNGLDYDHCNPITQGDAQVLSHHCHDCPYELVDENENVVDDVDNVFAAVERINQNADS